MFNLLMHFVFLFSFYGTFYSFCSYIIDDARKISNVHKNVKSIQSTIYGSNDVIGK